MSGGGSGSIPPTGGPYREPAEKPKEEPVPWYVEQAPTEKERELWVRFYEAVMHSPSRWTIDGKSVADELADSAIVSYRKRFGVVK